jgi:prepilin-type N-terminal cleavage/methylation domain-containing protein
MRIGKYSINFGFTLLELSVVLLVIGGMVAAVNFGSGIIKQAKLRNVISEITRDKTAILAFKDDFQYYPGDIPNFSSFIPAGSSELCVTDNTDYGNVGLTYPNVCNGDGNFYIDTEVSANYETSHFEDLRAWEHLSIMKYIPGQFSGKEDYDYRSEPGYNVPAIKNYPGAGVRFQSVTTPIYNTTGIILRIAVLGVTPSYENYSTFLPADLYFIDQKIDDGVASSGSLYAVQGDEVTGYWDVNDNSPSGRWCVDAATTAASANYVIDTWSNVNVCQLIFWVERNTSSS